ncbi:amino acid ABC transporter ATP-binding/permease protein [Oceanobacter mangrovi]|uniref:amino acid ABC transporter ATP-binding/permease protein n=1 Tax=Oceanobacter mangrovi TaxID=2862510 RepID=UPI001C8DF288|nr:ATP-binding cassette domain-containing protein [Oceanobacter mangrovi]
MKNLRQYYFELLSQQQRLVLFGILLAVLTAFSGIALLAVSGWFISAAALAGLSTIAAFEFNFFTPGAMVRGLSISRTLGRYGERLVTHEATFRLISRLRADLFRFIGRGRWSETQLNRHETASRLLQDIQYIESIYLSALVPTVVTAAVTLGYLLTLALVLPVALLWVLPLLLLAVVIMPLLYSRQVLDAQDRLHRLRSEQWQSSSSLLSNMRTLTLHQRLQQTGHHLTGQSAAADQQEVAAVNRQQGMLLLAQIGLIGMTVLVFWQGFVAWQAGELAGAMLFMLLLLTLGTGEVLINASPVVAAFQLGMQALERLQQLQSGQTDAEDSRVFAVNSECQGVQLQQLDYRYPGQPKPVFERFNHQFSGPGWHWICGPSGGGKSTLMALLSGQLQANGGSINFSVVAAADVGLMPQRIDILRASLRDNLCLNHPHSDAELQAALALVELDQWAQQLPQGLDTWLGDGEWQPSGGECKRLGLARLVLRRPQIILLDEPAAGMDQALAQTVFGKLAEHWQQQLVIANTHDRQLIQPAQHELRLG